MEGGEGVLAEKYQLPVASAYSERCAGASIHQLHHPGGGRGPVGKVAATNGNAELATSPNWTPAFAGEVLIGLGGSGSLDRIRRTGSRRAPKQPAYFFFARKLLNPSISQRAPDRIRIASRSLQIIPSRPGLK